MADVFISYSTKHRDLTERLAAIIEAERYSVWWDVALESWGSYRDQIDAALAAAKVVVVIWSEGAAASPFVQAECGKALKAGKLVNIRALDFPSANIPLPFNACHVDRLNLDEPQRILKSIRGAWAGRAHEPKKPLYEHYEDDFGVSLFDPKRSPLSGLDIDRLGPSDLLQARTEVVPYIDATGEGARMLAWCRDIARPRAGCLIHGPGGYGKTRLMIETARRLRMEHGWLAGFLQPMRRAGDDQEERRREQAIEQLLAFGDEAGVLFVIDYAEGRRAEVEKLGGLVMSQAPLAGRPVRVVLLSRGDQWWRDVFDQHDDVRELFRAAKAETANVIALDTIPPGEPRRAFYVDTVTAYEPIMAEWARKGDFPGWNGQPPDIDRLTRVFTEPAYARPLAIQMEAMLFLASDEPEPGAKGVETLLDRVLGLEEAHWRKALGKLPPADDKVRTRDMRRAVAQVTAVQGVAMERAAERLLMADPFYEGQRVAPVSVAPVLDGLGTVYGRPDGVIGQLEPDLVGEHLTAAHADARLIDGCVAFAATLPEGERDKSHEALVTVLQRATRGEHGEKAKRAEALIDHLVRQHGTALAKPLMQVMESTPGRAMQRVEALLGELPLEAIAALSFALPRYNTKWLEFAVRVTERHVAAARDAAAAIGALDAEPPDEAQIEALRQHSTALNNHAVRQGDDGRREDALAATEEAVALRRALADARPGAFTPDLALSLNNLGSDYAALGRREDAPAATEEAVTIRRALAAARPGAFTPDLATSLWSLMRVQAGAGDHAAAAAAGAESLWLFLPLLRRLPAAYADKARTVAGEYVQQCATVGIEPDEGLVSAFQEALTAVASPEEQAAMAALNAKVAAIAEAAEATGELDESLLAELPPEVAANLRQVWANLQAAAAASGDEGGA